MGAGGTNLPVLRGLCRCSQTPYPDDAYPQQQCGTVPAALRAGIDACDVMSSCADGTELPVGAHCDGVEDCPDGSDEPAGACG